MEGQDLEDSEVGKEKDNLDRDCRYEVRGKLLKQGDERDNERKLTGNKEWKEMGTGQLQILYGKGPLEGKRYLLMRDEKLGRIVLNTVVVNKMKFVPSGKANIRFFTKIPEPEVDDTGKIVDHKKTTDVNTMLNLKVAKEHSAKTLEELMKAVPNG